MKINFNVINQFLVCLSLCLLLAVSNSFAQTSYTIIPGVRFGAITARTSGADLKRIYGRQNVRDTEVDLGEGETLPGTVIYPNDPSRKIEIVWKDKARKKNPDFIQLTGEKSRWQTKQGIGLGTNLKYLQKINGKPFELAGFEWDYGGTVYSWKKGKLAKVFGNDGQVVTLRLGPAEFSKVPEKDLNSVAGDGGFSSNNKVMQRINPKIYQMIVDFP